MGYPGTSPALAQDSLQGLLEDIYYSHGLDFRDYALSSLERRIRGVMRTEGAVSVGALRARLRRDPACAERLLPLLSVGTTSMFRDPAFYQAFRTLVVPRLREWPFIRLWHAGCSTGEEVYSLAILLEEEGLYDRCRVYATDMNPVVLGRARRGIFPLALMREYTRNYQQAGGARDFSDYYTAGYEQALFHPALRRRVVFAPHNLATDNPFQQFQVILCRNVMIYFNDALQDRVHRLLYQSLEGDGYVGLGSRESMQFTPHQDDYRELAHGSRLYQKVR